MELVNLIAKSVPGTPIRRRTITLPTQITMRIGIVGYGKLGQYIVEQIMADGQKYHVDLAFIWNRTPISEEQRSHVLVQCPLVKFVESIEKIKDVDMVDLIVEVCHPDIVHRYAEFFLEKSDFLIGSTAAFADEEFYDRIKEKLAHSNHRMYVARGALWGANDIQMMAHRDRLQSVKVTMQFHPNSLRLADPTLKEMNEELLNKTSTPSTPTTLHHPFPLSSTATVATGGSIPPIPPSPITMSITKSANTSSNKQSSSVVLFEGPARELCQLAPNNVNTIATAALLGVGFDHTIGKLVADTSLVDFHRVFVEVRGKPTIDGKQFEVQLERKSTTSNSHNVSSLQTYASFWHSVLACTGAFTRLDHSNIQVC